MFGSGLLPKRTLWFSSANIPILWKEMIVSSDNLYGYSNKYFG